MFIAHETESKPRQDHAIQLLDLSSDRRRLLEECQTRLGYEFANPRLLIAALTHASSADSRTGSNERLEFLGDSVLGLVICEQLFLRFPDLLEGELTKIKSVLVSRNTCARLSAALGMQRYLILGKGMACQASIPRSVMADVFESLIAAVFLDGGLERARAFILQTMSGEMEKAAATREVGNYKSLLQQKVQHQVGSTPTYEIMDERGPDHAKLFKVAAVVASKRFPPAWGRNKKEAEQRAALNALSILDELAVPIREDDAPDESDAP